MVIGFSTGSVALDDVQRGLAIATNRNAKAVELSALREDELDPLLQSLGGLQEKLRSFEYISFHAPSKRTKMSEEEFVDRLQSIADRGWAIIVHPDVIDNFALWRRLGRAVCIENMDKRKRTGRTVEQLKRVFTELPDASFCFDVGHARQVDPTMQEAEAFLRAFGERLQQVHMSHVNSSSRHERLNHGSILAFQQIARLVKDSTPIILETPVDGDQVEDEIATAKKVFDRRD